MFSRFQRFYNSVKIATDLTMLALAFGLAYVTRFYSGLPHESIPPAIDTWVSLAMVLVIFPLTFRQQQLYTTNRSRTHTAEVFEVFKGVFFFATPILLSISYLTRERYSRMTLLIFVVFAFVLVAGTRVVFREVMNGLRRRGFDLKTILVIGTGELAARVIQTIHGHPELGFRVVGALARPGAEAREPIEDTPVMGDTTELDAVLASQSVDQVIIALPMEDQPLVKELMERLALHTVDVKVVPDLYQYITLCGGLEEFGGLPIISLQGGPLDGWSSIMKRAFDLAFAGVAILITAPLLLALALLVKLTSKGPVLYRQERMGMDGRTFQMLKFRTMRVDAEGQGPRMTAMDDPRRTLAGAWLRRLSLDELPQLFNVLRGDMSLVGPRPERPVFIESFKQQIPKYHLRHKVKAGITGWAQINGLRGQTSISKRIEYDLYYIENWSLLLDLKILWRTAVGGFLSRNAY